jgi:hypothetical protein
VHKAAPGNVWFTAANTVDSAAAAGAAAGGAAAAVIFLTCVYITRRGAAVMPAIGAAISGTCIARQQSIQTTMHICQFQ